MDAHSPAALACLDRIMGGGPTDGTEGILLGPIFVLVEGPMEIAEEALAMSWENDKAIRRTNRRLQPQGAPTVGIDKDGKLTLNGRACCFDLSQKVRRAAERMPAGTVHTCTGCGSQWRVEVGAIHGAT